MSPFAPIRNLELQLPVSAGSIKSELVDLNETDRRFVRSPSKVCFLSPNTFSGLFFTRWIHEIDPTHLGNISIGLPFYQVCCVRLHSHQIQHFFGKRSISCSFFDETPPVVLLWWLLQQPATIVTADLSQVKLRQLNVLISAVSSFTLWLPIMWRFDTHKSHMTVEALGLNFWFLVLDEDK